MFEAPPTELLNEHLTALRIGLFFCCVGWWAVLFAWLRPTPEALRRGALASMVQLGAGLLLDWLIVRAGAWTYRPMSFTVAGIPLDLHIDWTLLWGFGLVWLSDRWPGRRASIGRLGVLLMSVVALTLAFDVAIHQWMIFLDGVSPWWWLVDAGFLTICLGLTLAVYRSMGRDDTWLSPYARSLLYVPCFGAFFFWYLPAQLDAAAASFGLYEAWPSVPLLPGVLAVCAVALGGWATREFAVRGRGTPVPWDPPRHLVRTGPYAWIRCPMQTSGMLLAIAVLLHRPSWVRLAYVIDIGLVVVLVFWVYERDELRRRFGDAARRSAPRAIVRYDAGCVLCQGFVRMLRAIDRRGALGFRPLADPSADSVELHEPPVSDSDPGLMTRRSRAVLRILGYLPPLPIGVLAAVEGVPGACWLLDRVYARVAARRRWLNRCCSADRADSAGARGSSAPAPRP